MVEASEAPWPIMQELALPGTLSTAPSFAPPTGVTLSDVGGRQADWSNVLWDIEFLGHAVELPLLGAGDGEWISVVAQKHSEQRDMALHIATPWRDEPEETPTTAWLHYSNFGGSLDDPEVKLSSDAALLRLLHLLVVAGYIRALTFVANPGLRLRYVDQLPLFTDTYEYVPPGG